MDSLIIFSLPIIVAFVYTHTSKTSTKDITSKKTEDTHTSTSKKTEDKDKKWMSNQVPERFQQRLDKYFNGILASDVANMKNTDLLNLCLPEDRIIMKCFLSTWRQDPLIIWASGILVFERQTLDDFMSSISAVEKPHVVSLVLSNNNINSDDITCLRKYLHKDQFPCLSLLNMKGNNVSMEELLWIKHEFPDIIILTDTINRPPVWPSSSSVTSDSEDYC